MKYTLKTYGWSMDAIGKSLTDAQVSEIKQLMENYDYDEIWEARYDFENDLGIDIWDGDLFRLFKVFDNGTITFVLHGENDKEIIQFGPKEMTDLDDLIENYYEKNGYEIYNAYPNEDGSNNIYLSVDENKGGMFTMTFESDEVPTPKDFTYTKGRIETPDGDWDFISKILFKGVELEVTDWLDNTVKSATVNIFTSDGEQIN
jgi:hypothetical protein